MMDISVINVPTDLISEIFVSLFDRRGDEALQATSVMSVLDVVGGGPSDKQGWIKGVSLGLGLKLEILGLLVMSLKWIL